MSYQVIARRWRPKLFADVVGQDHVTRTLRNALKQGRLPHALLFTGPRGVGKTSTARILARAVNCPNIDLAGDAEPCNVCETCQALFEDRELDVIEMDAASYRGVDDVRRINDTSRLAPVAGRKKIYIIDEVHMFTKEAFNAFLKTLEEPPEHVIFILATTDAHKVPNTILSRVQRFDFHPVKTEPMASHLATICTAEGWNAEAEALWVIARRGEGSLRDAEGLLDQVVAFAGDHITLAQTRDVLGVLPDELLEQATQLIAAHATPGIPAFLEQLALRGVDYKELLKSLQGYWMDMVFIKEKLPVPGRSADDLVRMRDAGGDLAAEDLFRLIRLAEDLEDSLKWSTAPRVRFDVAFMRWVTLDRVVTLREILDRLDSGKSAPLPAAANVPAATRLTTLPESAPPAAAPQPVASQPAAELQPTARDAAPATGDELAVVIQEWPRIAAHLRKKSPGAAAMAETNWTPVKLDGRKLTIRAAGSTKFALEQLKNAIPHLSAAIDEICGMKLTVTAVFDAASRAAAPQPKAPERPAASPPGNDDRFENFKSRFGGEEVDPKTVREPE